MKIKPILFSTPMVRAIMDGSKVQTRRIIKPRSPEMFALLMNLHSGVDTERCISELIRVNALVSKDDVMWVRETTSRDDSRKCFYYKTGETVYDSGEIIDDFFNPDSVKWKPSIFMPKDACRNFLKTTKVRVERLWDISEEDSEKEGVLFRKEEYHPSIGTLPSGYYDYIQNDFMSGMSAKESFRTLWISINGKESWDDNPFLFAYDFNRTEKPLNFNN